MTASLIGFLLRHPNRVTMAVAEFFRPGALRWKVGNARFQLRQQKIREQTFVASGDAVHLSGVAHAPECEGRTRSPLRGWP
jgi:hypothetical protein